MAVAAGFIHFMSGHEYPVPFSHPTALNWNGDTLWAADSVEQALFRLELKGGVLRVLGRYPIANELITGIAAVGDYLYLANATKGSIEKRRFDAALTLENSWPSPGPSMRGLASAFRPSWE